MKIKRLIISVFVGWLYGISPGRNKVDPPTSIKILSKLYYKTLKVAFRVGKEKPIDKLLIWTRMPTWESVLKRAMEVNYIHLRHPIKCPGKIIEQDTGSLGFHVMRVRFYHVGHTKDLVNRNEESVRWRKNKHPRTGRVNYFLYNESCPICGREDTPHETKDKKKIPHV